MLRFLNGIICILLHRPKILTLANFSLLKLNFWAKTILTAPCFEIHMLKEIILLFYTTFLFANHFMMIFSYTWFEFGVNWTSMRTPVLETDFWALKLCIAAQFSVWFLGPIAICHSKFGIFKWKIKLKKKWTWSIFSLLQQLIFWKLVHFIYSEKAPNILKKIYHFSLTFFRQPVPPLGMDSTKASTGCRTSWKMLKTNK